MTESYDILISPLNYLARLRADLPLLPLLKRGVSIETLRLSTALQLLILLLGTGCALTTSGSSIRRGIAAGALLSAAVLLVQGAQPLLMHWHWFPFLVAGYLRTRERGGVTEHIVLLLLTVLWAVTAGGAGVLGILLVPLAAGLLERNVHCAPTSRSPLVLLLTSGIIVSIYFSSPIQFPSFPPEARLVPVSPFNFYHRPLLGSVLDPNPLYYPVYVRELKLHLLLFASLFTGLALLHFWRRRTADRGFGAALAVLLLGALLIGGELVFPPSLGAFAPYPTLVRLLPGLGLTVPWALLPAVLLLAAFAAAPHWRIGGRLTTVLALLLSFAGIVRTVVVPLEKQSVVVFEAGTQPCRLASGFIRTLYPAAYLDSSRALERLRRLQHAVDFEVQAQASVQNEKAMRAVDLNSHTRWATGRPQAAGDWFELMFDRHVALSRVVLSTAESPADFPRGIEVQTDGEDGQARTLLSLPDWPGALRWNDSGCPYLGHQSEVILELPPGTTVKRLRFTLLAGHPSFDWSIHEVKLFAENSAGKAEG